MGNKNMKSYLMFISSMLIFGTVGIFRKYIPLSSGMIAFFRGLLGSAFLLILFVVKGHKTNKIEKKELFWLIVTGAVLGLNWMLLFEAYHYTSVAIATMCYYMQPTIVILLSPIVFKEQITIKKLFCAIAAIIGMVFVSGMMDNAGISAQDLTGILCGLGAAVFYSLVIILNKKVQIQDVYEKTIIQLISSAMILIPYLLLTENWSGITLDTTAVIMVLTIGMVHTGIAYALYFGSMKDLKAQSIAVLSYIDPVFALLLSASVLHEKISLPGIIGALLIIGSALVSEISAE